MTKVDVGYTFGRLTVADEAPTHVTPNGTRFKMWRCICTCGSEKVTREARLLSGETVSCGCRGREVRASIGDLNRGSGAPSYHAVHARLARTRGAATEHPCEDCGDVERRHQWSYVRACPGELLGGVHGRHKNPMPYCLHVEHYAPRCRSCHDKLDTSPLASVRRLRSIMLVGGGDRG